VGRLFGFMGGGKMHKGASPGKSEKKNKKEREPRTQHMEKRCTIGGDKCKKKGGVKSENQKKKKIPEGNGK